MFRSKNIEKQIMKVVANQAPIGILELEKRIKGDHYAVRVTILDLVHVKGKLCANGEWNIALKNTEGG